MTGNTMETDSVSSLLWKFSVPAVAGMVVGALYNVVDSIFVGRGVGEIALTAVTISFPIMTLLMAVGMLVGVGASAVVSISLGQKNKEKAEWTLGNALTMMLIFVLSTTGIIIWKLDWLLVVCLGASPEVLPYAHDFLAIILLGSVFLHVGFGLNAVIRAQGDPKIALATQVLSAVINAILNYYFVFQLGWGISGSAWATVIAQGFAAAWVLLHFTVGKGLLHLRFKYMIPRWRIINEIVKIGVAPFLLQVGASLVMVVLNLRIMLFGGETAVAAFGIINRVFMMVLMPVAGICQGAQPIIGYNYGARKFDRVLEALKIAVLWSTLICVIGFASVELFAAQIIQLFNDEPRLINLGTTGLRTYLVLLPVIGFQITSANYFQAIGKAYYAVLFNILRQILVLIPMVFLLSHYFGLSGVWFAGPVSDFAATIATGVYLLRDIRKDKRRFASA